MAINPPIRGTFEPRAGAPVCGVCGEGYHDYDVWYHVWNAGVETPDDDDALQWECVPCLERDIQRQLNASDFTGNPVNRAYIRHCDRCNELYRFAHELQWYCTIECAIANGYKEYIPCGYCERRFPPTRKNQVYCSRACAYSSRKSEEVSKPCEHCHEIFDTFDSHQKYCSVECSGAHKKVAHGPAACACGCGVIFTPRRADQRFASRPCATRYARAHKAGPKDITLRDDWLPGCGSVQC